MRIPLVPPSETLKVGTDGLLDTARLARLLALATSGIGATQGDRYLHWDQLRHRPPPAGLSVEDWWVAAKLARTSLYREFGLVDTRGRPFKYASASLLNERLHRIDRDAAGALRTPSQVTDPGTRDRYLMSSLFEEAITSSQLEGASTTREAAKAMLREGRGPANHSERMIVNNFRAMEWLRSRDDRPLTPETVFELHRIVTEGTLERDEGAGRFRAESDAIVVGDETGRVLHRPPAVAELPRRLEQLCAFGNASSAPADFLHPVLRSILLHFWLAYDHPFVDGNGRVARALFYWSMARHGYWLCEYLSISRILRRARGQYLRSFLYCETDENDATYFLVDQLRVLDRAVDDLHAYLARKARQMQDAERNLRLNWRTGLTLNERQLALLAHAMRKGESTYTVESHRASHRVAYQTARTDLLSLEVDGLLTRHKRGNRFVFMPSAELRSRAMPRQE